MGELKLVDLGDENEDDAPTEEPSMEALNAAEPQPKESQPSTMPTKRPSPQCDTCRSRTRVKCWESQKGSSFDTSNLIAALLHGRCNDELHGGLTGERTTGSDRSLVRLVVSYSGVAGRVISVNRRHHEG